MDLLFAYGTLLLPDNPFGFYLTTQSVFSRSGRIKGELYDVGEYPGGIYNSNASTYIYGSVISITNVECIFKTLDEYEGFGEEQALPNEFIRQSVEVECDEEIVQCWVYLYNLSLTGLARISSGNYKSYLQTKKSPEQSPEDKKITL